MTDPLDIPDTRPTVNLTITFPEDADEEALMTGAGQDIMMVGEGVSEHHIILALLRAAESILWERVKEGLIEQRGVLQAPPAEDVEMALVGLNTRLAAIHMLGEMPMPYPRTISISI